MVRHYHGHLSACYSIDLHPTLDLLVTCGRDATARVSKLMTCGRRAIAIGVLIPAVHKFWETLSPFGRCWISISVTHTCINVYAHAQILLFSYINLCFISNHMTIMIIIHKYMVKCYCIQLKSEFSQSGSHCNHPLHYLSPRSTLTPLPGSQCFPPLQCARSSPTLHFIA